MVKLPISDYVANYYKEQGIEFTFRQQAHFCWAYHTRLEERVKSIKEILAVSDDEKLNTEIRERLDYEEKAYGIFVENHNQGCIYVVHSYGEYECQDGYFSSFQNAVLYGNGNCRGRYGVVKRYLSDQCPEEFLKGEEPDEYNTILSEYVFTPDEGVKCGYSCECPAPFDEEDKCRFENMFLNIKSPFGLGDIVMGEGFDRPGVVASGHDSFEIIYDRHKKDTEVCIDGFDNRIRVDFTGHDNDPSYNFNYDQVHPFGLWKIDTWDDEEYWEILKFMSNAIRQNVDLLTLDYLMHEYSGHY